MICRYCSNMYLYINIFWENTLEKGFRACRTSGYQQCVRRWWCLEKAQMGGNRPKLSIMHNKNGLRDKEGWFSITQVWTWLSLACQEGCITSGTTALPGVTVSAMKGHPSEFRKFHQQETCNSSESGQTHHGFQWGLFTVIVTGFHKAYYCQ